MTEAATQAQMQHFIEIDQENHRYFVDGEEKISVTQVLSTLGMIDDRWYTEYGRWRGSAVHLASRFFDEKDVDRRTLDQAIKPFLADWVKFREMTKFVPSEIETQLYDPEFDFCGTPDRIGYFCLDTTPDIPNMIVDLKAYQGGQIPWWVRYQLAGYGRLKDKKRAFHRFAVVLTGDGPKVEHFSLSDYVEDVNEFLACVRAAKLKRRNQEGG